MSWPVDEVVGALEREFVMPTSEFDVHMLLFDENELVGVGRDYRGRVVVVLPGQESPPSFETAALRFDPWSEVEWLGTDRRLPHSAAFRCLVDEADAQEVRLVAHVLVSLIDLQSRFGQVGPAIASLRTLFAEGFGDGPSTATIVGVFGEVLVIRDARDPNAAVRAWHVDVDDRYDFSVGRKRVEVKTTLGTLRSHHFTSRQLPPLGSTEVYIASIRLARVANGTSLAELAEEVLALLEPQTAHKFLLLVAATTGVLPFAVTEPRFDAESGASDLRLFKADDVPTPRSVPGVGEISWTAFIDQANALPLLSLDDVLGDKGTTSPPTLT